MLNFFLIKCYLLTRKKKKGNATGLFAPFDSIEERENGRKTKKKEKKKEKKENSLPAAVRHYLLLPRLH